MDFHLETERLILRGISLKDLEKLSYWFNDEELNYYDDDRPFPREPEPLEETKKYLERLIENNQTDKERIDYGIYLKDSDQFIGTGQIVFIDHFNRRCMLSICLGDKDQWGKGYAKELISKVIEFCFEELKLNRIGAEIFSFNERSIGLFESLGFQREGIKRSFVWKKGKFEDEYNYSLLLDEWKPFCC
ncbi:MAG: GNAT family N-acetyltransferase [Spirochaetes bacterium]|nr:GNAT family N-acetyltransferase [Spirochaetota bacterium]